jgi:hypothetical protein
MPHVAAQYIASLFKVDPHKVTQSPVVYKDTFLFSFPPGHSAPQHSRLANGRGLSLIDYVVDTGIGTVVRQALHSPSAEEQQRWHLGNVSLMPPVFFFGADGKIGVPLERASHEACMKDLGGERPCPIDGKLLTSLALNVGAASASCTVLINRGAGSGQVTTSTKRSSILETPRSPWASFCITSADSSGPLSMCTFFSFAEGVLYC